MTAGGWIWYELLTRDVAGALAFCGKVVGWKPVVLIDPQGAESGIAGPRTA